MTPLQIVCGAPNVRCWTKKVAVATIGTNLVYSRRRGLVIKKRKKFADEESHGMICAEDELGLGESP